MKKDYYVTVTEANGQVAGPFRLPLIESFPEAVKWKRKEERKRPGCKVAIEVKDADW